MMLAVVATRPTEEACLGVHPVLPAPGSATAPAIFERASASAIDELTQAAARSASGGSKIKKLERSNLPEEVVWKLARLYAKWDANDRKLRRAQEQTVSPTKRLLEPTRLIEEQRQIEKEVELLAQQYG